MSGFEATLKIRQFLKEKNLLQPIIIGVSGDTEEIYIQNAYKNGLNGVSGKPLDNFIVEKVLKVLGFI